MIGNEKNNYLIVDMGGSITNISTVVDGSVVANRSIDVGGDRVTELLSQALGVSEERAEKTRDSQGLEIESSDIKKQVLSPIFKNISDEIRKSIGVFDENYPDLEMKALILTGGLSQMKGFINLIENEIKLKAMIGDPWSKVDYPAELEKSLASLRPYFGVAVGLALKGLIED
jgi:type IV pilus assembly protein PilM